uniref:Anaphase-promoting complex subunit 4 WD40 domain-containing protein n=1 Tax=Cyprinodon variegatus TaxID=28743 RepID=A0A3Q2CMM9_CYPVA
MVVLLPLAYFETDIVLVCCSDRSIQVLDMNKGAVGSVLPDSHSRAIHSITQNKGSTFTSQAPESYNVFLTSAITDGVKMWDLRTMRCVRRYENHVNRCHPCSCAISPCGRFIASGSEDNCAYVYDIRSSTYLHKLQRHSDTVLSVAFNPATPEVTGIYMCLLYIVYLFFIVWQKYLQKTPIPFVKKSISITTTCKTACILDYYYIKIYSYFPL